MRLMEQDRVGLEMHEGHRKVEYRFLSECIRVIVNNNETKLIRRMCVKANFRGRDFNQTSEPERL